MEVKIRNKPPETGPAYDEGEASGKTCHNIESIWVLFDMTKKLHHGDAVSKEHIDE